MGNSEREKLLNCYKGSSGSFDGSLSVSMGRENILVNYVPFVKIFLLQYFSMYGLLLILYRVSFLQIQA